MNNMNNMNMNPSLPITVPSANETTFQQHHHHHHHHVVNGVVAADTPFITPAKCSPMIRNNVADMPTPMKSLEFTPNTSNSKAPKNHFEAASSNFKNNTVPNENNGAAYNRKDKSLGLLCENFLRRYTILFLNDIKEMKKGDSPPALSIDEAANSLGVERRRIYDIINILQAIPVVSLKRKNMYY